MSMKNKFFVILTIVFFFIPNISNITPITDFGFFLVILTVYALFAMVAIFLIFYKLKETYGNLTKLFLNVIAPKILILAPFLTLIIAFSLLNFTFFSSYLIFLCTHLFGTLPLLSILNVKQDWLRLHAINPETPYGEPNQFVIDRKSPYLLYDLSFGLIYVYFYFFILVSLRFLMLGQVRNFDYLFQWEILPFIVLLLCYVPAFVYYIPIIVFRFNNLRLFLWGRLANIFYCAHLFLLQYNLYFKRMEKLYKIGYFIKWSSFELEPICFRKKFYYYIWRYSIRQFACYPWISYCILFLAFFFELVFTHQIFFFYYLMFFFFCYRMVWYFLTTALTNSAAYWPETVCLSDFLYKRFYQPRYPEFFWLIAFWRNDDMPMVFFFSVEEMEYFDSQRSKYSRLTKRRYSSSSFRDKVNERIQNSLTFAPRIRVYIASRHNSFLSGVRFVHTDTTSSAAYHTVKATVKLLQSTTLHNGCALAGTTWGHAASLVTSSHMHAKLITASPSYIGFPVPSVIYIDASESSYDNYRGAAFMKFWDHNLIENFRYLQDNQGIYARNYNQKLDCNVPKLQPAPDVVFTNKLNHPILSLDLKNARAQGMGKNAIIYCSDDQYKTKLNFFGDVFCEKHYSLPAAIKAELKFRVNNLAILYHGESSLYQNEWFKTIQFINSLTPDTFLWIPPIRIPSNFCVDTLTEKAMEEFVHGALEMLAINKFLLLNKMRSIDHKNKDQQQEFINWYNTAQEPKASIENLKHLPIDKCAEIVHKLNPESPMSTILPLISNS